MTHAKGDGEHSATHFLDLLGRHEQVVGAGFHDVGVGRRLLVFAFLSARHSHPDVRSQRVRDARLHHVSQFFASRKATVELQTIKSFGRGSSTTYDELCGLFHLVPRQVADVSVLREL